MVTAGILIDPAAGLVERVIHLQLLPVLLLSSLVTWVKAFLLSAVCSPRWERRKLGPLVCVYRNVRGETRQLTSTASMEAARVACGAPSSLEDLVLHTALKKAPRPAKSTDRSTNRCCRRVP